MDGQQPEIPSKLEDGSLHKTETEGSRYIGSIRRSSSSATLGPEGSDDDKRFTQECNKQLDKVCKFYESKETEIFEEAKTLRTQFDDFGVPLPNETLVRSLTYGADSEHKLEKLDSLLAGQQQADSNSVSVDVLPNSVLTDKPSSPETQDKPSSEAQQVRRPRRSSTSALRRNQVIPEASTENTSRIPTTSSLARSKTIIGPPSESEYMREYNPNRFRGLRFMRRFNSSTTINRRATDMQEFNRYYNFRARCSSVYISLAELRSYIHLNHEAFQKITKKWDKITGGRLRNTYCKNQVDNAHPFQPARTQEIETAMRLIEQIRQTVNRICSFLLGVIVYAILMSIDTMNNKPASKCLALLIFVAILWAFESLPLFATAYLIPLLIVPMDIIRENDGHGHMSAENAAKAVFSSMFNGTIAVLLGGFAIAAGLSRHGITKAFAAVVMSKAGTKPHWVILVNMYLATFLCMWISNVATPVLCFSLAQPILRTLPPNSKVGPCLILGIALASCIGGLSSPISSPQNIIAIQLMDPNPGWGIWFSAAIPLSIITVLTTWGMLLLYFRPTRSTPRINAIKNQGYSRPSYSQVWVSIVCLATIALWCSETTDIEFWGDNGVIALIPFVLLFGTNMLSKTDLNNFLWSVVTLGNVANYYYHRTMLNILHIAQGGMALGFAVESSGLLDIIGHRIAEGVEDMPVLAILFIFGILVLVFATFVSHTVAALIILPIVKQVGEHLSSPHPNLLVMGTGLTASVAMGLPVSGFPNMNAIMQEDSTGKPYLHMKDFLLCGLPSSIIAGVITILLGYGILSGVGY
ncbi:Sodium:sulfate symporter transmembrane region-domain-containing protein [Fennellomyces sp. T-0311]|nr:Sodium:sulfate symporter transmembrane region-domain-containing protein [Fennellomyces sp. T-0311]